MIYNKLIRDKIPEIFKDSKMLLHTANDKEYWQKLVEKLQEEVDEFKKDQTEEELADILEVISAICDYKKINKAHLQKIRLDKLKKRGGFKKKLILEEVMVDYLSETLKNYEQTAKEYAIKKAPHLKDSLPYLEKFSTYLKGNRVLEIGFGLGQDASYFIENNFEYIGVDAVSQFFKNLKLRYPKARLMKGDIRFLSFSSKSFDGIYAMASLLHLNDADLSKVMQNCHSWLKEDGIMYLSLKEGTGETTRPDGRYFNLFTKRRFLNIVGDKFKLIEYSQKGPRSYNTGGENWLNFYLMKKDYVN
jgi:predicted house-cleaning noncanonical NTP pyrophosphatase (MazG superfamily)/SAM-dependent methyltransferase